MTVTRKPAVRRSPAEQARYVAQQAAEHYRAAQKAVDESHRLCERTWVVIEQSKKTLSESTAILRRINETMQGKDDLHRHH
jgi:hypothetical protein